MSQPSTQKQHFMLKSHSRPTFAQDMTPEEGLIMQQHIAYWTDKMSQGIVHVFGPVFDPNGLYGMAVVGLVDEAELQVMIAEDPAVLGGLMQTEYAPMKAVLPGA